MSLKHLMRRWGAVQNNARSFDWIAGDADGARHVVASAKRNEPNDGAGKHVGAVEGVHRSVQ